MCGFLVKNNVGEFDGGIDFGDDFFGFRDLELLDHLDLIDGAAVAENNNLAGESGVVFEVLFGDVSNHVVEGFKDVDIGFLQPGVGVELGHVLVHCRTVSYSLLTLDVFGRA